MNDGSITWTVNSQSNKIKSNITSYLNNDLNNLLDNGVAGFGESTINRPMDGISVDGVILNINRNNCDVQFGIPMRYLASQGESAILTRVGTGNGNYWTSWRTIEQIITKSININGYIKYASGLILQWGRTKIANPTFAENVYRELIILPISFSSNHYSIVLTRNSADKIAGIQPIYSNSFNIICESDMTDNWYYWFAIGY